jgi:hypothetical protein
MVPKGLWALVWRIRLMNFTSAALEVYERIGSRRYSRGGLFQPSTVTVSFVVNLLCNEAGVLPAQDPNGVVYILRQLGFIIEVGQPFGFPGYVHPILGDTTLVSGYPATNELVSDNPVAEGYEVTSFRASRDTSSTSIYNLEVEMVMVEQQYLNHAELIASASPRQARAFRVEPERPTLESTTPGLVDDPLVEYTMASDINGRGIDFNCQPLTLTLAGTQLVLSCCIRAPYFRRASDNALTVSAIWSYWTTGAGGTSTGARLKDSNSLRPDLPGYRDYESIVESVNISKIVGTFHRLDVSIRVDEWYNLEQVPFSVNGTVPKADERHGGGTGEDVFSITQAFAVGWVDPNPRAYEPDLAASGVLPYNVLTLWKYAMGTLS